MKIKQLRAKNPKHREELWEDYRALYEGGHKFKDRATCFLSQNPKEPPTRYVMRVKESVYRPYVGTIIDFFAAQQFTTPLIANVVLPEPVAPAAPPKPVAPKPEKPLPFGEAKPAAEPAVPVPTPVLPEPPEWYSALEKDCDGKGTGFRQFLRTCFVDALITRWAFWRLDFPDDYGTKQSKAEAEEAGDNEVKLSRVKREQVNDWEADKRGKLLWAIVHEETRIRPVPEDERNVTRHTWWVMDREKVDKYVADVKDGFALNDEDVLTPQTINHSLKAVPLVMFDVSDGLWVANRVSSSQIEHYRLTSAQHWSMRQTCFAMPVFGLKDPDNVPPTMGDGYFMTIGNEDFAEWLAPPTEHLTSMAEAIKSLKDEIFRVVQQMALGVDNNAAAVGRTAESKSADAEQMHVVLRAYGELLRDAIKFTLNLLSKARNEDDEWDVEGLDKFETLDAAALVELYAKAQGFNIPSDKFHSEAQKGVARALLPGRDTATLEAIDAQIEAGVPAAIAESKAKADEDREVANEAVKAGAAAKAAGPMGGPKKASPFAKK